MERVPNLYVVGAAKSGTTFLASLLAQSDDVFCGRYKEPHFHIPDTVKSHLPFSLNREGYFNLYRDVESKYVLDASVLYLPLFSHSINSIRKDLGRSAKIIIVLREPLSRAISAYKHARRFNSDETLGFNEAVRNRLNIYHGNPMLNYYWLSDYEESVLKYQESFDDVLVLSSEFVAGETELLIEKLCEFLEIDCFSVHSHLEKNQESFQWSSPSIGRVVNSILPGRFRHSIRTRFPGVYHNIRLVILKALTTNRKSQVDVDDDIKALFADLQEKYESLIGSRR